MVKHTPRTIEDARTRLQVSRPTLYQKIATGELKTYKIGRRRFTTDEFIDAFIESSAAKAAGR
jgi:excisionase family DNA binding protein